MTEETLTRQSTHLHLVRYDPYPNGTVGCLTLFSPDGGYLRSWDTLELPYRDNRKCESSIPTGVYHVKARRYGRYHRLAQQRWKHDFALAVTLPGEEQCGPRTEIRIHWGNLVPRDSRGCVLVGQRVEGEPRLLPTSRLTFCDLYESIAEHIETHGHLLLFIEDEDDREDFDRETDPEGI